jgi:RNA polymerase sigma factor (sigma-70 family)
MKQSDAEALLPAVGADWSGGAELARLYRRYRDTVHRYVRRQVGKGPPDPDDVVQAAFERLATVKNSETVENPEAFLVSCARNYVIDQRRRVAVRLAYARQEGETSSDVYEQDAPLVLVAEQRWAAVEKAILQLDERSQRMLICNRIHGLSCAEIARRERCSPTLVKSLIARALLKCQQALREMEG